MLVDMRKLEDHERIRVQGIWYHVLSESWIEDEIIFPGMKTFYDRELEVEDLNGDVYYLRLKRDGTWELELAICQEGNKWYLTGEVQYPTAVSVKDFDYAKEEFEYDEYVDW